jgi:hypothetical protein
MPQARNRWFKSNPDNQLDFPAGRAQAPGLFILQPVSRVPFSILPASRGGRRDARPGSPFILVAVVMVVLVGIVRLANHAVDRLHAEMVIGGRPEHQRHVGKWDVRSSVDADLQTG